MPPKRKVETVEDKTEARRKESQRGGNTNISQDQGATGETATSSTTMETGTQQVGCQ